MTWFAPGVDGVNPTLHCMAPVSGSVHDPAGLNWPPWSPLNEGEPDGRAGGQGPTSVTAALHVVLTPTAGDDGEHDTAVPDTLMYSG